VHWCTQVMGAECSQATVDGSIDLPDPKPRLSPKPATDYPEPAKDLGVLAISAGVQWCRSPTGDTEVPNEQWSAYPAEWVLEAEISFQRWLFDARGSDAGEAAAGESSQYRRCRVGVDPTDGSSALPWTGGCSYSVDFVLMTCMEQMPRESRARVVPLRRFEEGVLSHPPPDKQHPWFLKRVRDRDGSDWLNNEFFFRAFTQAMADAGHLVEAEANEIFDFRFNQDFRGKREQEPAMRGGVLYREPVGWKKYAVRVKGKYDAGNNSWLCLDGRAGEWAIAYHGTNFAAMPGILSAGMRAGERQAYKDHKDARTGKKIGTGIYCTPKVETAAEFSPQVNVDGRTMQFVFQCRVRPEAIKRIHEEVGRESGAYWLVNDPSDIRPYGVLVRESPGSRRH